MAFLGAIFGRKRKPDRQELAKVLPAFIRARTWAEAQHIVKQHPALLSDEAEALLDQRIAAAREQDEQDSARVLEEHRTWLRHCRQTSTEAALAKKISTVGAQRVTTRVPPRFISSIRQADEAHQRYLRTSDLAALDEATAAWERILHHPDFIGAPKRLQLTAFNDAGVVLLRRYWALGRLDDLNRALSIWQEAVECTSLDFPELPAILTNLGNGLSEHYKLTGRLEDLEKAIRTYHQAVERTSPDSPALSSRLNNLGTGLRARYTRTGRLEDLEEVIRIYHQAVECTSPDFPELSAILTNLGNSLSDRYERIGRLEDLEEAIRVHHKAVECASPNSPALSTSLNGLGAGLHARYERTGRLEDLEEAIAVWREALERTPTGSPELAMYLNNLGTGLLDRYTRTGRLEDLEEAIHVYQQAVHRTPPDSPDMPGHLNNLGTGLHAHYERTGRPEDLEEAICVHHQAVKRTSPDSPDLPKYLNSLGNDLSDRYVHTGRLEDLEEAIAVWREAVERMGPDSPALPRYLNNLGTGLRDRYTRTGRLEDLEEAIHVYHQAVECRSPDLPELPAILTNLGSGLRDHYEHTGRLEDLEEAIRVHHQAVECMSSNSLALPRYLNNLDNGLWTRYTRTGRLEDMEEAIRVYREAVECTDPDSPDLAAILSNLGTGLRDRCIRTGRLEDLEEAIAFWREALERTPTDSPDLAMCLNNLGTGLRDRYARTGQWADLEEAIRVSQQALQRTPPDSPDLPRNLSNLGNGLRDRYAHTGQWADLEETICTYERALTVLDRAFLLSPVAYQLGQQGRWAGLAARAVEVHHQASRPARALAIAEGSKSRLLTTLLGRGQIPAPATIPGDLAEREQTLVAELVGLDAADLACHGSGTARESTLPQRQALMGQLLSLWEEMEGHGPEASDYVALRRGDRPDQEDLARLAADLGPEAALVSLFITGETTLLFVLRAGMEAPQAVEIPLDGAGWQDLLRRFLREVHFYDGTGRRAETWPAPLLPLLQEAAPHLDGARWIVLAPHAGGHLLPWGALAGRVGWAAAPVTTPALGVLAQALGRPAGERTGALVVGNPLGDLRYAEEEAQQVAALLGACPLIRQQATRAAVLQQLEQAGLAHFATHAYFASGSPLDSGVVLADGVLTAREIMERGLRAPEFLALSACQTGMAGALGGDEMAGLSQALLYAGARSLLVGLWTVNDPATAHLMAGFYRGWRGRGLDKATALREAMEATRNDRPAWAHTYYWGAFTLVGDWR